MFNFIKQNFNFIFNFIKQKLILFIKQKNISTFIFGIFIIFFSISCNSKDFKPAGELGDFDEILAIKATPPDVSTGDTVILENLIYLTYDSEPNYLWLICIPEPGQYSTTCVSEQIKNFNSFPQECTENSTELCVAGTDATALFTVPNGITLPSEQPFFYAELVVSDKSDIETACFDAIKSGVSDNHCLIGVKRILYTGLPFKNLNPIISEIKIDDSTQIPTVTQGLHNINLKVDPLSVNEVLMPDNEQYYLKIRWYTDCGKMSGVKDDVDPLNDNPYDSSMKCVLNQNTMTAECEDASNILEITEEVSSSCYVYAVIFDLIGGVDYKMVKLE